MRNCVRNVMLTILGLGSGVLLLKKPDDKSQHVCINEGICHGCDVFNRCILPQAISAKKNM